MYGASEFQVAAQTDRQMVQPSLQAADGHQIRQRLGGMLMTAIACIDDGDAGKGCCDHGSALFGMAHGADIRIAGNDADGVSNAFPFGGGGGCRIGEAEHASAKIQHGGLKAQPGSGTGFIEAGGEFFPRTGVREGNRILFNIGSELKQPVQLLYGKIKRVHQMSHVLSPSLSLKKTAADVRMSAQTGLFIHAAACRAYRAK